MFSAKVVSVKNPWRVGLLWVVLVLSPGCVPSFRVGPDDSDRNPSLTRVDGGGTAGADDGGAGADGGRDGGAAADGGLGDGGGGTRDAGGGDAGSLEKPSRCTVDDAGISCSYDTLVLDTGLAVLRDVHFQVPLGTPPDGGWPAVLFFQGSLFSSELAFNGPFAGVYGEADLTATFKALLDTGHMIVAPEVLGEGTTAWQTNVPPAAYFWEGTYDDNLMDTLLAALEEGTLAPVDMTRLYAMGISSGGFMTSRMAVSYPGRFRALAIHSASYATCSSICVLPTDLPADHPPTLFLHGQLDAVVPITAMTPYRDALMADGVEVRTVLDPAAGHQWLPAGPREVPAFFQTHAP